MAGIAEVVANDPHVVKTVPSEHDSVPDVDESLFCSDVSLEVDMFKRFLLMPYIIDDFDDHEGKRKPWSQDMYALHGRVFWDYAVLGNALKRGSFAQLIGGPTPVIGMFADKYYGPCREDFEVLVDSARQECLSAQEYSSLPNSIKALHVRRLKARIYDVLEFCEKKRVLQDVA